MLAKFNMQATAQDLLPKICPDIILLKTVGVTKAYVETIESQIVAQMKAGSFVNLNDVLPEWLQSSKDT